MIFFILILHPKLDDFGTSKVAEDVKSAMTVQTTTAKIMSPEFFDNFEKYNSTKPVDVFSFALKKN